MGRAIGGRSASPPVSLLNEDDNSGCNGSVSLIHDGWGKKGLVIKNTRQLQLIDD